MTFTLFIGWLTWSRSIKKNLPTYIRITDDSKASCLPSQGSIPSTFESQQPMADLGGKKRLNFDLEDSGENSLSSSSKPYDYH
jgi:hypothetical protein